MKCEISVPADGTLKVISMVGLIVIVCAVWLLLSQTGLTTMGVAVIILLVVTVVVSVMMTPITLIVDDNSLTIKRVFGKKIIRRDDMAAVEMQEFTPADIRVFGNGGLFSYTGWYYSRRNGFYFCYLRSRRDLVFLKTKSGRNYMLGCAYPNLLIDSLRSR